MVELIFFVGMLIMYVLNIPYSVLLLIRSKVEFYKCKYPIAKHEIFFVIFLIVISSAVFTLGFFVKADDYSILVLNIFNGLFILADFLLIGIICDSLKPKEK